MFLIFIFLHISFFPLIPFKNHITVPNESLIRFISSLSVSVAAIDTFRNDLGDTIYLDGFHLFLNIFLFFSFLFTLFFYPLFLCTTFFFLLKHNILLTGTESLQFVGGGKETLEYVGPQNRKLITEFIRNPSYELLLFSKLLETVLQHYKSYN